MTTFGNPKPPVSTPRQPARPRQDADANRKDKGPLQIGIAGLGRSGWGIHASALETLPELFKIAAVADGVPARREEAQQRFGCKTYDDVQQLFAEPQLDAVALATPNLLHAQHAIDALKHGLHVIAEKPMAMNVREADVMIQAAEQANRLLAPFQNRRFEAGYLKVHEIIASGALGRVIQVRMCWHQFTRRWDWQVIKEQGGGLLQVNGTHLIDQAIQFFGHGPIEVFADLQRALSCGNAEDHVKVVLRGDGPTVDIELTNANGFPEDRWLIMGTAGSLRGTPDRLTWKTVDWSQMPERELDPRPFAAGREYPREDIPWVEHHWDGQSERNDPYRAFYRNFHAAVRDGQPLHVTPQSVRRTIDVVSRAYADADASQARTQAASDLHSDSNHAPSPTKPCSPA